MKCLILIKLERRVLCLTWYQRSMKKILIYIGVLVSGIFIGVKINNYFTAATLKLKSSKADKFKGYYNILIQWLRNKQGGKELSKYLYNNGYKNIAIYGMGHIGFCLYEELKNTEICVKYGIDQHVTSSDSELKILSLEDELELVDVVIVTTPQAYNEVSAKISELMDVPVLSLEEIVYYV